MTPVPDESSVGVARDDHHEKQVTMEAADVRPGTIISLPTGMVESVGWLQPLGWVKVADIATGRIEEIHVDWICGVWHR